MNKWYIENGEQGDIVISTRVRLARNLEEYPFPCRLTVKGKEKVCEEIKNAVLSNDNWGFGFTWMKDFSRSQAVSLAERHLISPEFASDRAGRGLLLTDDEAHYALRGGSYPTSGYDVRSCPQGSVQRCRQG